MEMRGLDAELLAPQVSAPLNLLAPGSPTVGLLLAFCVDGVTNHLLGFYFLFLSDTWFSLYPLLHKQQQQQQ